MKTKIKTWCHSLGGAACAGALFLGSSASAQNLLVSTYTPGVVYEFSPGGGQSTFVSGQDYPYGMAFDRAGNLFVANSDNDGGNGYITEITPAGVQSTFSSAPLDPKGLAFNSAGDLFQSDYHSGIIYEYTPGGARSVFASGFIAPQALAFDSAGNLYVNDGYGSGPVCRITKIAPNGTQSLFASGLSGTGGLAFNSAGDLFEADTGSGNIYEFTPSGVRSTFASGMTQPVGMVFQPAPEASEAFNASVNAVSISTDSAGNLVYRNFGNLDLIQSCASQMDLTSPKDLHLVYDPNAEALEVINGYGTNQVLVCTPMTFSGGVCLSNKNVTKSERQAWVYWEGQTTPSGTLSATESYSYGESNQLVSFKLSGELQFALPGNGTNTPTIYQGNVTVGPGVAFPIVSPVVTAAVQALRR